MRKIFALITVLTFSFIMIGCGEITLSPPVISLSNEGVVSWTAIENADHYVVFIGTNTKETTETSYDLAQEDLAVGTYTIYVVAAGSEDAVSLPSNSVTYEITSGVTLAVPGNVTITGDTLTWGVVVDATGYIVTVNGADHNVVTTTFDLSTLTLANGTYSVTVKATDGTNQSVASTAVNYVVETELVLDAPTNLAIATDTLTWSEVSNALGYVVLVNGYEYEVEDETIDLSTLYLPTGTFTITVKAVAGEISSDYSTGVNYTIAAQSVTTDVYAAVLLVMDSTYEPDMVQGDFTEVDDYEDYLVASQMAQYYAAKTHDLAMSTDDSVDMFEDMFILMNQTEVTSFTQLLTELQMLEAYNITPERFTELLYGLTPIALNQQLGRTNAHVTDLTSQVAQYQAQFNAFLASQTFSDFYDVLLNHSTVENAYVIMYLFDHENSYSFAQIFNDMAVQAYNSGGQLYEDFQMRLSEEYSDDIAALQEIVVSIYNDVNAREFLVNHNMWEVRSQYSGYQNNVRWSSEELMEKQEEFQRFTRMMNMLVNGESENKAGLYVVVQFLFSIRENIPTSLIESIDEIIAGESALTPAEVLIIKNELVDLLQLSVPTAEEFAVLHNIAFTFTGSMLDIDLADFETESQFLGEMDVATIELGLYFIEDFAVDDLNEVMPIIYAITSNEFGPDPHDIIDLLTFVRDYVDTFVVAHQTEVDAFNQLVGGDDIEAIYSMVLAELIAYADTNIEDENEKEVFLYVLNDVADSYDDVIILLDMVSSLGIDMVVNLIDTQGAIIDSITDFTEAEDDASRLLALSGLLDDVDTYLDVLLNDLTAEQFEAILSFAKLPVVIKAYEELGLDLTLDELSDIADNLYPHIGQTVHASLELALLFVQDVDALDISTVYGLVTTMTDENDALDISVFIDLLEFVQTFMDDFVLAHPTEVATFDDLTTGDSASALYTYVLNTVIAYLDSIPVEQQSEYTVVATYVLNELLDDFDNFVMFGEMLQTIGDGVIDQLILSDGSLIDLIINTPEIALMTETETLTFITSILDEFTTYHAIVNAQLTETQIDNLLQVARIPAVAVAYLNSGSGLSLEAIDTAADTIYPFVIDIIKNIVSVETQIVAQIDLLDVATYFGATAYTEDPGFATYLMMIDVLDTVVTANATLVDDTVDIIFDDIFSVTDVQTLLGILPADLTTAKTNVESDIAEFKADLATVAALDFSTLTETQIDDIESFILKYNLYFPLSFEDQLMMSEELVLNVAVQPDEFYGDIYYQFTPVNAGTYTLTSSSLDGADPAVHLFDAMFQYVSGYDDNGGNAQFVATIELNAGETIYFEIYYYNEFAPFSMILEDVTPTS